MYYYVNKAEYNLTNLNKYAFSKPHVATHIATTSTRRPADIFASYWVLGKIRILTCIGLCSEVYLFLVMYTMRKVSIGGKAPEYAFI